MILNLINAKKEYEDALSDNEFNCKLNFETPKSPLEEKENNMVQSNLERVC